MTGPLAIGRPAHTVADGDGEIATLEDLGRELKGWLRRGPRRGIKVAALAKRLEVSQSTLYAYLAGTTLPPTDVLDDLLHAIEVPTEEHRRLATARDALERRRRGDRANGPVLQVPCELPADPLGFVGRTPELQNLDTAFRDARSGGPSVAVLSGVAGVGKTAMAMHWCRRNLAEFPDGCLYVDLLGFAPGEPRQPAAVLAGFLRSLGVADADVPQDTHERENRLRTRLAGQRLLVVLDNALDVAQVRPLLPGDPSCFVVVTSRSQLDGLHVQPGAHRIAVTPLETETAAEVLRAHVPQRISEAEPGGVRMVAERCGGLPLALRVVGAYASSRPEQTLDTVVDELGSGLDVFDIGDDATSVRAVFSWSERRLSPQAAETFHLLGLSPLPMLGVQTASALCATDTRTAGRRIDELERAHLVHRSPTGRLSMHDLVREYARERAGARLATADSDAAVDRLLEHLAVTAAHAVDLLHPWTDDEPREDETEPTFRDRREAQVWVDDEWDNLMSAVRFTADSDRPHQTIRLVTALRRHLDQGGRHLASLIVMTAGRDAARRTGDRVFEATAVRDLGAACLRLGRYEQATRHYRDVLALTRSEGDRSGEAGTLNNLGNVHERLGNFEQALDLYHRALPIARELGIESGEATLLVNIGVTHARLDDLAEAMRHCRAALVIFERLGDTGGTARTLGNIGDIHRSAGEHADAFERLEEGLASAREIGAVAIETEIMNALGATRLATGSPVEARACYQTALTAARETGDRFDEARALEGLGHSWWGVGEIGEARSAWDEAGGIYRSLGLPDADRLRYC